MEFFIARQPILDRRQRCFAYELLFRSNEIDNYYDHPDPTEASRKVIADSSLLFGLDSITGGKKAFVNVTREVLLSDYLTTLPKDLTVIEVMEDVEPDAEVIHACRQLHNLGYKLALDDFIYTDAHIPLMELADFIKIDFLLTKPEEWDELFEKTRGMRTKMLAEKVETREQFEQAMEQGFHYFQGYFFSEPQIVHGREIAGFKLHYMRMLREIHKPELDFPKIEQIIRQDISLSYKLLRYVNSAAYGWQREITSIHEALVLLGELEIKKLVSLVLLTTIGKDRPEQLMQEALIRARFCEVLGERLGWKKQAGDLFLLGMFSLIDAFVGRPMEDVLNELPIGAAIKAALLGEQTEFRELLDFAISYERGNWDAVTEKAKALGLSEAETPQIYLATIGWVQECFYGSILQDRLSG